MVQFKSDIFEVVTQKFSRSYIRLYISPKERQQLELYLALVIAIF